MSPPSPCQVTRKAPHCPIFCKRATAAGIEPGKKPVDLSSKQQCSGGSSYSGSGNQYFQSAASAGVATTSLELSSPAQQLLPSMHHLLLNCHHKPFQQRLSRLPEVDERSPTAAMANTTEGSTDELNQLVGGIFQQQTNPYEAAAKEKNNFAD